MIDVRRAAKIPGWMLEQELEWLAQHAQSHRRIVEVGSWKGRSTRALGDHALGVVYAVDHWRGEPSAPEAETSREIAERGAVQVYEEFRKNLLDLINACRIVPVFGYSTHVAEAFGDVDMVFIDGDHSYESVRADIRAWRPRVRAGGILAGHDYMANHPGVVQAVDEHCKPNTHHTIWWTRV